MKSWKDTNKQNIVVATLAATVFLVLGVLMFVHAWKLQQNGNVDESSALMRWASEVQTGIHEWNVEHGICDKEGALIESMTIGYRKGLSRDIRTYFADSGVSHILAISGFHVSIIYFILQFVFLKRLVGYRWQIVSQSLIILALWVYALIAGMSPSIVRAVTMCSLLSFNKLYSGSLVTFRVLVMAAIIMFIADPLIILNVGFQLSFASMIGIYLIGLRMISLYEGYCFVDRFVWCTVCLTISCTLFTLPIVSMVFGKIAVMGIVANIIVTTLTYLVFGLYLLFLPFAAMANGGMVASAIREWLMGTSRCILNVTEHIASLPYSVFEFKFSVPGLILYYAILGMVITIFIAYMRDIETKRYENVV